MKRLFRYIVLLIVLTSLGSIVYGFSAMDQNETLANRCIGFGVVGLFLLAMPLFLMVESRGKKWQDYMLNDENIRKMQGKERKSSENQ